MAALGSIVTATTDFLWFHVGSVSCLPRAALLWFTLLFQWKTFFSSFLRKDVQRGKCFAAKHVRELSFCSHLTLSFGCVWNSSRKNLPFWKAGVIALWLPSMLEPEPFWPWIPYGWPVFPYPEAYRIFSVFYIHNFIGIWISISEAGDLLGTFNMETHVR